jgi:hypothetical protein
VTSPHVGAPDADVEVSLAAGATVAFELQPGPRVPALTDCAGKEATMKSARWLTVSVLVAALALVPAFGVSAAAKAEKADKPDKAEKADKADKADKTPAAATRTENVVPLDQVPAAVKATIDKEAKDDAAPVAVTRETDKKGKTYYEVQMTKKNKAQFVHIAEDGKVLKRDSARKQMKEESKADKK